MYFIRIYESGRWRLNISHKKAGTKQIDDSRLDIQVLYTSSYSYAKKCQEILVIQLLHVRSSFYRDDSEHSFSTMCIKPTTSNQSPVLLFFFIGKLNNRVKNGRVPITEWFTSNQSNRYFVQRLPQCHATFTANANKFDKVTENMID